MPNEQFTLHIGIVDFSEPTLLVLGNPESFLWLAERISGRQLVAIEWGAMTSLTRLRFVPTAHHRGRLSRHESDFEWDISASESEKVAEQLKALAANDRSGHAYLDPASNEAAVELVASINEYDPSRVFG
jgi:hypothetical protein